MTPTEALQTILSKIKDVDSTETLADLVGEIEEVAQTAVNSGMVTEGNMAFSFNGFEMSRRGMDSVLKGAILASGGQIRLTLAQLERYRLGYDLRLEGTTNGLVLTATERR